MKASAEKSVSLALVRIKWMIWSISKSVSKRAVNSFSSVSSCVSKLG